MPLALKTLASADIPAPLGQPLAKA